MNEDERDYLLRCGLVMGFVIGTVFGGCAVGFMWATWVRV